MAIFYQRETGNQRRDEKLQGVESTDLSMFHYVDRFTWNVGETEQLVRRILVWACLEPT